MKRLATGICLSCAAFGAAALVAVPASAGTTAQIIAALNQTRAANGIPAGITENTTWSQDCAAHVRWMLQNHVLSHVEQPGSPGYTAGGAWVGPKAVLASGVPGFDFTTPASNPYLSAPYHLAQLMNPRLSSMGAWEQQGADCESTYPGYTRTRPRHDRVYTYPGNHATISWFETARELPDVPGAQVGLPQGTTTGPNIIAFGEAGRRHKPLSRIRSAWLKDAAGHKLALRTVNANAVQPGVVFMIPVAPLRPASIYKASVAFKRSGRHGHHSVSKRWTFTTTHLLTGGNAVQLQVSRQGSSIVVRAAALDPAYDGRAATLRMTFHGGPGGTDTSTDGLTVGNGYETLDAPVAGEVLDLNLAVHGFSIGSTSVAPFDISQTVNG